MAEEACEQVIDVLAGRSARYAVNAPLLTPETARAIAPYLPLTETLGRIAAQYFRGAVKTLTVDVAGDLADYDASQLTAAALRGILENATSERVNLINAGFLARNRGLTVNERKTNDAGTFASLVTLTVEGDTGKAVVAGTIANGEPRLVRIDDNWLDMAPTPLMLVTRHQDKPGTMGRIGLMLGEADVNISSMHLARTAPSQDALMLLAVDDEVPDAVAAADPEPPGGPRRVGHPGRHRPLNSSLRDAERPSGAAPLIPDGLDAILVLLRHGQTQFIVEKRFQGQMEAPLTASGRAAGRAGRRAPGTPSCRAAAADPRHRALRHRPLPAGSGTPHRGARGRGDGRGRPRHSPTPPRCRASRRSPRASGRASRTRRSRPASATRWPAWRRWPTRFHAPGGESLEQVRARVEASLAVLLAELADGTAPRHAGPTPGPRLRGRGPREPRAGR